MLLLHDGQCDQDVDLRNVVTVFQGPVEERSFEVRLDRHSFCMHVQHTYLGFSYPAPSSVSRCHWGYSTREHINQSWHGVHGDMGSNGMAFFLFHVIKNTPGKMMRHPRANM